MGLEQACSAAGLGGGGEEAEAAGRCLDTDLRG